MLIEELIRLWSDLLAGDVHLFILCLHRIGINKEWIRFSQQEHLLICTGIPLIRAVFASWIRRSTDRMISSTELRSEQGSTELRSEQGSTVSMGNDLHIQTLLVLRNIDNEKCYYQVLVVKLRCRSDPVAWGHPDLYIHIHFYSNIHHYTTLRLSSRILQLGGSDRLKVMLV